jgi:hypothetical protein
MSIDKVYPQRKAEWLSYAILLSVSDTRISIPDTRSRLALGPVGRLYFYMSLYLILGPKSV